MNRYFSSTEGSLQQTGNNSNIAPIGDEPMYDIDGWGMCDKLLVPIFFNPVPSFADFKK